MVPSACSFASLSGKTGAPSTWSLLICDYKHWNSAASSGWRVVVFSWDEETCLVVLCVKMLWLEIPSFSAWASNWSCMISSIFKVNMVLFAEEHLCAPVCAGSIRQWKMRIKQHRQYWHSVLLRSDWLGCTAGSLTNTEQNCCLLVRNLSWW